LEKNNYITMRSLPVKLKPEELLAIGENLATDSLKLQNVEIEKKEVNADFTANINRVKETIHIASVKIDAGKEDRNVECRIEIDIEAHRRKLIRMDTQEVVEDEELTTEDLQQELEFAKTQ